ncbi:hypothetical protein [Actinoallomurus sp. CA-150999]
MSKRGKRQTPSGDHWRRAQVLATLAKTAVDLLRWFTDGGPGRL